MENEAVQDGFLGQRVVIIPKQTRKELKSNVLTAPFYITDIGRYPNASHHMKERRKGSNQDIFIYCISGKGWVRLNGETIHISANEFIIIEKNTPHQYAASEKDPWTILWMHYTGHLSEALYQRYKELSPREREVPFLNERIKVFEQIFEVLADNYRAKDLEYACLLSLNFMSSFIFNKVDKNSTNFKKNNLVQDIISFLNQNLDKTLKSDDLAEEFHYSVSHILSTFKKNTGYPLFQFFNMKKVQKACEYLNYTDLSIKEISFKLGYQDPLYFSRLFKSHMGVSPRQYRNDQFD